MNNCVAAMCVILPFTLAFAPCVAGAETRARLEVADAIETVRLMPNEFINGPLTVATTSPDGTRYAIRLVKGDLKDNGLWLSLLQGELNSLEAASRPRLAATLFTKGFGRPQSFHYPLVPALNPIVWIDGERPAFLWEDEQEVLQVVVPGEQPGATRLLTHHLSDVVVFSELRNGKFVFSAHVPASKGGNVEDHMSKGFAVESGDAFRALNGDLGAENTLDQLYTFNVFVQHKDREAAVELTNKWIIAFRPLMSLDGRYALVNASPPVVPQIWAEYKSLDTPGHIDFIAEALRDPNAWYGRQLTQLFLVNTEEATARALWDAPTSNPYKLMAAWSLSSKSVIVGPTFAPARDLSNEARGGWAFAEVDVETGDIKYVPTAFEKPPDQIEGLSWVAADSIQLIADGRLLRFRRSASGWNAVQPDGQVHAPHPDSGRIKLVLEQNLNTPPSLHAMDTRSGRARLIRELNPDLLKQFKLGRVEQITFSDAEGEPWSALLYYPVDYARGKRFPLVVQTHGHAATSEFSLYGLGDSAPGLGPGWSIYAAQVLAGRNIAVLHLEDKKFSGPDEPVRYMRAYEAAIEHFVAAGLVDRKRVGLAGFSRTGWHVEYALTHSKFPYAAAIASDHMSGGYLENTLSPGAYEREIGASPFGEGLQKWLERSPAFGADRVHTPLRLQAESGGLVFAILSRWEMFSRLRQLKRPVEFYIIPNIDRGSHNIQNPEQCLASQQGAVDWFDFWLNGDVNRNPVDTGQNLRWRKLQALHRANVSSATRVTTE